MCTVTQPVLLAIFEGQRAGADADAELCCMGHSSAPSTGQVQQQLLMHSALHACEHECVDLQAQTCNFKCATPKPHASVLLPGPARVPSDT